MSKANFLEKLLDGAEVEWKPLGRIVNTVTAPAKLKREAYREVGRTPIIDQGADFIAGYTDEDVKALPHNEYVIFGDHSEHIKYVDFSFIQGADGLKILKPVVDVPKYIYYAIQNFYQKELNYKRHWSRASDTLIPIPCPDDPKKSLAIQAEIVRILDAFTALTAELTAELTARKKQYNYYRDQLLTFSDSEVEWTTLERVIYSLKTGLNPRQNFQLNTQDAQGYYVTVREIQNGKITFSEKTDRVNEKALKLINGRSNLDIGDVLFSGTGTVGRTAVVEKKPENWNIKEGVYVIKPIQEQIMPRYLAHLLNSREIVQQYSKKIVGNPVVSLPMGDLKKLKIPVPSLDKQGRLIAILDKFDTLTNSISEGLPHEIELRQKQYEYYRDLLLNFPKPIEEAA